MSDFNYRQRRQRNPQSFDKNTISLTKAGQTFNVYDKIQEGREDTEIYPTLQKYGCIDRMMLNKEDIYQDFKNFKNISLRDLKAQQQLANNMWQKLPLETRQKFNNDKNVFLKDGEKYIKQLIDEDLKNMEISKPITTVPVENKGEATNE